MIKKDIQINFNLTWRKIVGTLIVITGLYGFIYGINYDKYVSESLLLITTGAGLLGYTKWLTSKQSIKNE